MNPEQSADVIDAGDYSVDELQEAAFEGRGRLARPLALALLTRKDYPEKTADLQRILTDEREQPRLRVMAATALGEMQTPQAVRALDRGLQSADGVALRAVVKALASVGTRKHVAVLEELAQRRDSVGREAHRAATIIAGRLKARRTGAAPAVQTVPLGDAGEAAAIRVAPAAAKDLTEAVRSAPSRRLARTNAISLDCQGRRFVFLFDEDSLEGGLDMFKRRGEVGVVAEPRQVEGTGWEQRYRVAVEPEAQGRFRVMVTTADGRPVFAGTGTRTAADASFQVGAVDRPGALPVEVRGRFDGRRLSFEEARSAVRRGPARHPTSD